MSVAELFGSPGFDPAVRDFLMAELHKLAATPFGAAGLPGLPDDRGWTYVPIITDDGYAQRN
ncbi:hypothetical protein ACFOMD_08130 [Sphingoaurantiacus capsulatus]|uniref:Acyl-CoA dehydrogenase n=1 Tax=Sphingoaurantiacus capsulatus TaxID=1771310 RepID=A0ABV7XA05_9SPHN